MIKTEVCPDPQTLQRYLLGKIHGPERSVLDEHLLGCDQCVSAVETVVTHDELTKLALGATPPAGEDRSVIAQLIERIKQAQHQMDTVRVGETFREDMAPSPKPASVESNEMLDFLAPAQAPDELGRLGDYRVLEVIGMGGMGLVLRAEDTKLRRQVALKTMKPSIAERPTARARFMREAQATAALEHDNIVPIYQVGEDRGVPFIAMQYLKGEPLGSRLNRTGRLSASEVVRIGKEVASGLALAHEHGMIHRDIKPDNIWLNEKADRAKILDFGLVSATAEDEGLTQAGTLLGTPRYMAPEQALANPVDHRCDLFSLGSVLYHALVGETPFRGSHFAATLISVAQDKPRPIQESVPDCPDELSSLVMRLLEKSPDDRPQSAAEVVRELNAVSKRYPRGMDDHEGARPVADESPSGAPSQGIQPQSSPSQSDRIPPNRNWRVVAGLSGFAAALLGIVIITIKQPDGTITKIEVPEGATVEIENKPSGMVVEGVKTTEGATQEIKPTRVGYETTSPIGANKTALWFNGIDNYVDITSDWTWDGEDITFEAWISPTGPSEHLEKAIMSIEHGSKDERRGLQVSSLVGDINGKRLPILHAPNTPYPYITFARDVLPKHHLVHVAVVWREKRVSIYFDGKRQVTGDYDHKFYPKKEGIPNHTYLGASVLAMTGENGYFWEGLIHQARITSGVLYADDFTAEQNLTADSRTLGLYKFDEGDGEIAKDSSGNNRHGKIHGAKWISLEDAPKDRPLLANAIPILVEPNAPLGPRATVSRPIKIEGLRSWSIEPIGLNDLNVNTIGWHPSGDWFFTYEESGTVRIWSADGELINVIFAHEYGGWFAYNAATLLDEGKLLATISHQYDPSIRIWDTSSWKCVLEIPCPRGINARGMAWSPTLRRLAVVGAGGMFLVDPANGRVMPVRLDNDFHGVDFTPDGRVLIATNASGNLYWYDSVTMESSHKVELDAESDEARVRGHHVACSPNGRWVAYSASDGFVRVFNAQTGDVHATIKTGGNAAHDLQWFRDSQRLAVSTYVGPMISVWDVNQSDRPLMKSQEGEALSLAISPDEEDVYYFSSNNAGVRMLALNVASGLSRSIPMERGTVTRENSFSLSGKGDRVASLHQGVLTISDSETGKPIKRHGKMPTAYHKIEWAPGDHVVALLNTWQVTAESLTIVNVDTGETRDMLTEPRMVWSAAWSPDGTQLAIAGGYGDEPIEIFSWPEGKSIRRLPSDSRQSFSLAWSPDGKHLAGWSKDQTVRVWNPVTGELEQKLYHRQANLWDLLSQRLVWHSDSQRLTLLLNVETATWNFKSGELPSIDWFESGAQKKIAYSPDREFGMLSDVDERKYLLYNATNTRKSLGIRFPGVPHWHSDNGRVLFLPHSRGQAFATAFDTKQFHPLGRMLMHLVDDNGWIVIGPEGHYRGGILGQPGQPQGDGTTADELAAIEKHIVYTTMHEDGSRHTYTPAEFREKFNWKNDPNKATLMALPEYNVTQASKP